MGPRFWFFLSIFGFLTIGCQLIESILLPDPKPVQPRPQPEVRPGPKGTEFHVQRDGFSFPNYTGRDQSFDLSLENLQRLCGENVCARGRGASCVPSASIRTFWRYANESANGGRCEGMSVLSRAIYDGYVPLNRIDASSRSTYDLRFTPRVQSEIAYWHATQLTAPTKYHQPLTPSQIVYELQNNAKTYSLGFCMRDLSGCHAVNPIRVIYDKDNPKIAWIHVYDSNYVGDSRKFVRVNTATTQWTYDNYEGDANSKTLFIRPFANRLARATCPTDGNLPKYVEEDDEDDDDVWDWQFWLNGDGKVLVPEDTRWIPRTSDNSEQMPIFVFKKGKEVRLKVIGKVTGKPTNLAFFRQGQSMTIEGIQLDEGETDRFVIGKDGNTVYYTTTDKEDVTFTLGATYEGADYKIKIAPITKNVGFGARFTNHVDKKGEHELSFQIKSANGRLAEISIDMTRIGDTSDEQFTHAKQNLSIGGNETIVLKYGKWLKNGQALEITRDLDSDGKVDRVQRIDDDE